MITYTEMQKQHYIDIIYQNFLSTLIMLHQVPVAAHKYVNDSRRTTIEIYKRSPTRGITTKKLTVSQKDVQKLESYLAIDFPEIITSMTCIE